MNIIPHRRRSNAGTSPPAGRSGFTLTELLVVIVILGILSSLILAGLAVARDGVRAGKTSTTIRKLNEVLLPHYEEYEVRRPSLPTIANPLRELNAELRRIALRRLMTLELPQSRDDIGDIIDDVQKNKKPNGAYAALGTYPGFTIKSGSLAAGLVLAEVPPAARRYATIIDAAAAPDVSSAELLYMIVMRGAVADGNVIVHFRPDEIGDVDDDGLPEFLDAWRRPIRFRRWPAGLDSPVQPAAAEPDLVISTTGYPLIPLIYSAGSNGEYDLEVALPTPTNLAARNYDPFVDSPTPVPLAGAGRDDITNHDLLR